MIRNTVTAFFIILILAVGALAGMPTDKGNMFIAGGLSFTKSGGDLYKDNSGDTPTTFSIYPEFYYFIRDRVAIGGNLGYTKISQGDNNSATDFSLGFGAKYYFRINQQTTEIKGALLPYCSGRLMYTKETYGDDYKRTGFDIDFAGGGVYMLSDCVGAFGEIDFSINSRNPNNGDSKSGTQFGFLIGITYFIVK